MVSVAVVEAQRHHKESAEARGPGAYCPRHPTKPSRRPASHFHCFNSGTRRQWHGFQAAADASALPEAGSLGADHHGTAGDSNLDGTDAVAHGLLNLLLDPPLDRGIGRRVGAGLDDDRAAGPGGLVARARWAQKPAKHG